MRFLPGLLSTLLFSVGLSAQTGTIRTAAGPSGSSVPIGSPVGVAVDAADSVFLVFADRRSVFRMDPGTGVLTRIAGNETGGQGGDGGPAVNAQLARPTGMAADAAGNLYVADPYGGRVRKVSHGVISTVAGKGVQGFGGDGGLAIEAELSSPSGIATDSAGNLYIADWGNHRVRKVSDGIITTVAGNGLDGSDGDGGPATEACLRNPSGVAVDAAGNLYIADINAARVRMVSRGVIRTVAGNGVYGSSGDGGPATSARLSNPTGIALDAAGNLYIADTYNAKVRKVSAGVITTVAGNGVTGYRGDGGPAADAELNWPRSIAVDSIGNLYIADSHNECVRVVSNAGVPARLGGPR